MWPPHDISIVFLDLQYLDGLQGQGDWIVSMMYFYSKDIQKKRQILDDFGITIICTKTHSLEGTDFRGLPFYPVVTFPILAGDLHLERRRILVRLQGHQHSLRGHDWCDGHLSANWILLNLKQAPHIKMIKITQDDSRCHLPKVKWHLFSESALYQASSEALIRGWKMMYSKFDQHLLDPAKGSLDPLKPRNHQPTAGRFRRTATWSLARNELHRISVCQPAQFVWTNLAPPHFQIKGLSVSWVT